MKKIIYNAGNNKQLIFTAESGAQVSSVLKMKDNYLYYEFLLKNHKVDDYEIKHTLTKYVLDALGMEYVECKISSSLDLLLKDQALKLFQISKHDSGIKKYLQFNFSLLHRSFINSVLQPLAVISKYDDCEGLPDNFIQQLIANDVCYHNEKLSDDNLIIIHENASKY